METNLQATLREAVQIEFNLIFHPIAPAYVVVSSNARE